MAVYCSPCTMKNKIVIKKIRYETLHIAMLMPYN